VPGGKRKMTCKGVGKSAAKGITHEQYRNCVLNKIETVGEVTVDYRRQKTKMKTMVSVKHELHTVEINKTSLSADDDKRYLRGVVYEEDGVTVKYPAGVASYAYGHKNIKAPVNAEARERAAEIAAIDHGGDLVEVAPATIQLPVRPGNLLAI